MEWADWNIGTRGSHAEGDCSGGLPLLVLDGRIPPWRPVECPCPDRNASRGLSLRELETHWVVMVGGRRLHVLAGRAAALRAVLWTQRRSDDHAGILVSPASDSGGCMTGCRA